ncbi:MAG: single-stranded-DNA-specific exonuclease RecJ, partial [Desulfobulbaceae bacterium]|nr:single-stranded-DNA-specific exonuclease RecJ [Desulfobulbaceae bacterium]
IDFLYPKLASLPSPSLMKGMDEAVGLVITAFKQKKDIVIHGDYDVDGISSTALLSSFLHHLDIEPICYIPDRLSEGYGLSGETVRRLAQQVSMPGLLITVDCGITAVEEVELAHQLGFNVIITDHHEPLGELPAADAILNPKNPECSFPYRSLAGVGVVFYLIMGIRARLVEEGFWTKKTSPNLKQFLDLVALGTVADVMQLTGVNRVLVRAGLDVLSERVRPGVWALCERASIMQGRITGEDISYRLAPRLNAAGRVDDPMLSFDLLTCKDTNRAMELARRLDEVNRKRRSLESAATEQAMGQAREQVKEGSGGLVVYGPWHPGVVGIVASRIVDRFSLPVIVFTDDTTGCEQNLKGSGRSVKGVNLFETLGECTEFTLQHGGHAMAAGLTLEKTELKRFSRLFDKLIVKKMSSFSSNDSDIYVDYYVHEGEVFEDKFIKSYDQLGPFGEGNPEPVFIASNLDIVSINRVKSHLSFKVKHNGSLFHGIWFGMGDHAVKLETSPHLLFTMRSNFFRGEPQWEIRALAVIP